MGLLVEEGAKRKQKERGENQETEEATSLSASSSPSSHGQTLLAMVRPFQPWSDPSSYGQTLPAMVRLFQPVAWDCTLNMCLSTLKGVQSILGLQGSCLKIQGPRALQDRKNSTALNQGFKEK